jgi:hypothetical protein
VFTVKVGREGYVYSVGVHLLWKQEIRRIGTARTSVSAMAAMGGLTWLILSYMSWRRGAFTGREVIGDVAVLVIVLACCLLTSNLLWRGNEALPLGTWRHNALEAYREWQNEGKVGEGKVGTGKVGTRPSF